MGKALRRGRTALVAGVVAVASVFAIAPVANAWHFVDDGVAIRSAPYTSGTTIYGRGYNGQGVTWVNTTSTLNGSSYSYNNSNGSGSSQYWWYLTDNATGVTGWSGRYFVSLTNN
ncbi:MAG TPA: hypothetical protein VGC37_00655 [Friedmanniella sp.]